MARSNIHVGLEIGSTKTVMVVAEIKPDESAKILGMGETRTAGRSERGNCRLQTS